MNTIFYTISPISLWNRGNIEKPQTLNLDWGYSEYNSKMLLLEWSAQGLKDKQMKPSHGLHPNISLFDDAKRNKLNLKKFKFSFQGLGWRQAPTKNDQQSNLL